MSRYKSLIGPRLLDELNIGRADGRYGKLLKQFAKVDVLALDDWDLARMLHKLTTRWRFNASAAISMPMLDRGRSLPYPNESDFYWSGMKLV